jgi:hypothetical protein
VLQQEACVRYIQRSPVVIPQRHGEDITLPQIHQVLFTCRGGLPAGFRNLLRAAFDSDHAARRARRPRHPPRQLRQPATDIEDSLSAPESQLAERRFIEDFIQLGEPRLLFGSRPV